MKLNIICGSSNLIFLSNMIFCAFPIYMYLLILYLKKFFFINYSNLSLILVVLLLLIK